MEIDFKRDLCVTKNMLPVNCAPGAAFFKRSNAVKIVTIHLRSKYFSIPYEDIYIGTAASQV